MGIFDLLLSAYYAYLGKYIYLNSFIPIGVYDVCYTAFRSFIYVGAFISLIYLAMSVGAILSKKQQVNIKTMKKSELPFVTIQIPTKNEIIALRCAKKCINFNYPNNRYEIIIGDDSTKKNVSDRIDRFIKQYKKKFKNIKLTRRPDKSGFKPGNLNYMLKHTKGEIIVLFDSDFAPGKDFLKKIVVPFKDKKVSAVQARWKFSNADKNLVTALGSNIVYTFHQISLLLLKKQNKGFLCGSAEAVRKKDLIRLGGWKSGSLTEDIEYSLRLHKDGKQIFYLPDLECYNESPSTPRDLYNQQMRWSYGVISAYKTHTKSILTSENLSGKDKFLTMTGCFGYFFPFILILIIFFGLLSLLTVRVTPIDINQVLFDISKNLVFTSGLLVASTVALCRAKKAKLIPKVILSSFTVGLVTTFYVNKGIIKALFNRPMKWYLLKKSEKIN